MIINEGPRVSTIAAIKALYDFSWLTCVSFCIVCWSILMRSNFFLVVRAIGSISAAISWLLYVPPYAFEGGARAPFPNSGWQLSLWELEHVMWYS